MLQLQTMFAHLISYKWWIIGLILTILFGFVFLGQQNSQEDVIKTVVERGDVTTVVSVSGFVEAVQTADLAFPTTGVVTDVFIREGDLVEAGEVLLTQAATRLVAERNQAVATLRKAEAQLAEVQAGASAETRAVSAANVNSAEDNLQKTKAAETEKVENARRTLLSSNLEALAKDSRESATAPPVTGTYTCENEGMYELNVYK